LNTSTEKRVESAAEKKLRLALEKKQKEESEKLDQKQKKQAAGLLVKVNAFLNAVSVVTQKDEFAVVPPMIHDPIVAAEQKWATVASQLEHAAAVGGESMDPKVAASEMASVRKLIAMATSVLGTMAKMQ